MTGRGVFMDSGLRRNDVWGAPNQGETDMAKGQKKSNKEARKPKKEVKKTIAANPSTKGVVAKD
jgi:hypothetical protein